MIANTSQPPYYAVVFTSLLSSSDPEYSLVSERMVALAKEIDGFLSIESARNDLGITESYWRDESVILKWKQESAHRIAQRKGRTDWYSCFKVRVCKIERDYGFN